MFERLYDLGYEEDKLAFGEHAVEAGLYRHGDWQLIAIYPAEEYSDGQDVEVYCAAYPARFYQVRALPGSDSMGTPLPAFTASTGSGTAMRELAAAMAKAISEGMLSIR